MGLSEVDTRTKMIDPALHAQWRLNVSIVLASNGYLIIEFDRLTGLTFSPRALMSFSVPPTYGCASRRPRAN
jgi:hypothetical protein